MRLMLSLGNTGAPEQLWNEIQALFLNAHGQQTTQRRIGYPSGHKECAVTWLSHQRLWAAFPSFPSRPDTWFCWFGCSLPKNERTTMVMDVEINMSVTSRHDRGRALIDDKGRLYLGHRGGLGGGRGGQIKISEFTRLIKGFHPQATARADGVEESAFVIGTPQDPDFLESLRSYVRECARLRQEARAHRH